MPSVYKIIRRQRFIKHGNNILGCIIVPVCSSMLDSSALVKKPGCYWWLLDQLTSTPDVWSDTQTFYRCTPHGMCVTASCIAASLQLSVDAIMHSILMADWTVTRRNNSLWGGGAFSRFLARMVSRKSPLSEGLCVRTVIWASENGPTVTCVQYGPTNRKWSMGRCREAWPPRTAAFAWSSAW